MSEYIRWSRSLKRSYVLSRWLAVEKNRLSSLMILLWSLHYPCSLTLVAQFRNGLLSRAVVCPGELLSEWTVSDKLPPPTWWNKVQIKTATEGPGSHTSHLSSFTSECHCFLEYWRHFIISAVSHTVAQLLVFRTTAATFTLTVTLKPVMNVSTHNHKHTLFKV